MKRYLCSHWALNRADTEFVKSMGFSGLRFDIPWGAPREYIRLAFNMIAKLELEVLAIIGGWMRWQDGVPVSAKNFAPPLLAARIEAKRVARCLLQSDLRVDRVAFDLGNEPDISEWDSPIEFASFVRLGAQGIWEIIPTATVIVGGVSNVDRKKGARYLDAICAAGVDERMVLGIHPYRGSLRPDWAPRGWSSIDDVFAWLKSKGRRIWVTECGWHTSPQKRRVGPWGICSKDIQWSDSDIAEFASLEMKLWESAGAEVYTYFQLNSGPDSNIPMQNYGVRDSNMFPKPIACEFQLMRIG